MEKLIKELKNFNQDIEWEPIAWEKLDDIVGGTATPASDKLFGALVTTFKNRGKTKEDLAHFIRNSDSVFKVNGMEGVTMDDAMDYLDRNW